jgi:hypothetical protein
MSNLQNINGWMVVYVAYSEPEAYVVKGRLESEGIGAFVHQEPIGRAYGLTVGPLGEVKVLVRAEEYDQALAILEEDIDEDDDDESLPDPDDEDSLPPPDDDE